MKAKSKARKSVVKGKPVPVRFTKAQVLRQVGLILLVVAIWAGLLVATLRLTTSGAATPAPTPSSTVVPATTATTPAAAQGPSFSADVLPLFTARCGRCHGGDRPSAGLNLLSYASVLAGSARGPVVVPGSSATSTLVELIVSGAMPQGAAKLPAAEIETIRTWVDAGAPNN